MMYPCKISEQSTSSKLLTACLSGEIMEFWDYLAICIHRVFVTACSAIGPHDERMLQQANCASRPRAHRMPEVDCE